MGWDESGGASKAFFPNRTKYATKFHVIELSSGVALTITKTRKVPKNVSLGEFICSLPFPHMSFNLTCCLKI